MAAVGGGTPAVAPDPRVLRLISWARGGRPRVSVPPRPSAASVTRGSSLFPGSPDLSDARDTDGASWTDFRRRLTPDYRRVWVDISTCYLMLAAGFAALAIAASTESAPGLVATVVLGAIWCGFWLYCLSLFAHESAHFGLSADRKRNDRLAETFVVSWFGQTAKGYRRFHWEHHRHLGDPADTEVSYHECLDARFVLRSLTGLATLSAATRYGGGVVTTEAASPITRASALRAAVLHLFVVAVPLALGRPAVSVAWVIAVIVVYPSLNSLRQLLEHRPVEATCEDDLVEDPLPPRTRNFRSGPVSRWFGAAGFTRHLLHHWDPSVSYTNLREMEVFLRSAGYDEQIEANTTSYPAQCVAQFQAARAR